MKAFDVKRGFMCVAYNVVYLACKVEFFKDAFGVKKSQICWLDNSGSFGTHCYNADDVFEDAVIILGEEIAQR